MIFNLFLKDTDNVGDSVCRPLLYFNFGEQKSIDITKWKDYVNELKDNYIIIGGGGLFHIPSPEYNEGHFLHIKEIQKEFKKLILWGVGHNVHNSKDIKFPSSKMKKFKLIGVRDVGTPYRWVPCPSCKSCLFDEKTPIKYEAVHYAHKTFHNERLAKQLPTLYCCESTFENAVHFLGSARIVYTNSYHGAYWSLLMGKTVIVDKPYSSKFYGLSFNMEENADTITIHPVSNYLELCRTTNNLFFEDVKKLIEMENLHG